jgi:hypothetical protein
MRATVPAATLTLLVLLLPALTGATGPPPPPGFGPPPLDLSLMAFKEQGVWYFLCEAPIYLYRIPPHFLTIAPPPACWPMPPVHAPCPPAPGLNSR